MMNKENNSGHRERLRKKFLEGGIKTLADYELLELLLTYSIPRRDVKPLAKVLLRKFDSLSSVFNASASQLLAFEGLGDRSAALIKLIHACHIKHFEDKMFSANPLTNPEDVVNFSKVFLANKKEENLLLIFVNSKNKIRGYEIVSEGTIDCALVYPRRLISRAIDKNSNGVIVVHNHPSGDPTPSSEDINMTKKIRQSLKEVDIRLLDHIVVGVSGYFSFLDKGIL